MGRGHTITLTPELVSTGIGQPVEISIIYRDSDNSGLDAIVSAEYNLLIVIVLIVIDLFEMRLRCENFN